MRERRSSKITGRKALVSLVVAPLLLSAPVSYAAPAPCGSNVSLKKAAPTTTTLPNGRVLQITLKDVKDRQFIIDTSINQPGGTVFLPLLEVRAAVDVPVFIAGQTYQNGMLIIAIKILPK